MAMMDMLWTNILSQLERDKVTEGSTIIFGDTIISLKHNVTVTDMLHALSNAGERLPFYCYD